MDIVFPIWNLGQSILNARDIKAKMLIKQPLVYSSSKTSSHAGFSGAKRFL